jgi:lysophospholipase L1-like esterase
MDAVTTKPVRRQLAFGKRCLFAVVPLLALLTLAELVARCLVSEATLAKRFEQIEQIIVFLGNEPGQSIFQPDTNCFWRLKPNIVAPAERGNWWGGVMSNSHGMRSREVSVEEAMTRTRVLCFGDSTTFAFGVDFADAWPNQLQTMLDQESANESTLTRRAGEGERFADRPTQSFVERSPSLARRVSELSPVEVLNAGIPGHTSYQGRQRLAGDLKKWRPHLTVITFGNNDGWRWDGLADKDHAIAPVSSAMAWMNHSRALSWLRSCRLKAAQQQATNDASRWAEQATLNYFHPNERWTPRVSLDDFADNLRAMIAMCREHDSDVVLIVWPDQRQLLHQPTWRLPYQEATRQVAAEAGVACVDLVPPFEQAGRWGVDRFLPRDVIHVDRAGNRLVAKAIATHVRSLSAHKLALTLDGRD